MYCGIVKTVNICDAHNLCSVNSVVLKLNINWLNVTLFNVLTCVETFGIAPPVP